jgi:uncharacterized protein GlcG (DUF336 family)
MPLTSSQARAVIVAAEARASAIGVAAIVAVVDAGAHLKAFTRMDDAVLGSIDVALKKARTSALFQANSEAVWEYRKPGAPAHALEFTNDGLVPFGGGVLLQAADGAVFGATQTRWNFHDVSALDIKPTATHEFLISFVVDWYGEVKADSDQAAGWRSRPDSLLSDHRLRQTWTVTVRDRLLIEKLIVTGGDTPSPVRE